MMSTVDGWVADPVVVGRIAELVGWPGVVRGMARTCAAWRATVRGRWLAVECRPRADGSPPPTAYARWVLSQVTWVAPSTRHLRLELDGGVLAGVVAPQVRLCVDPAGLDTVELHATGASSVAVVAVCGLLAWIVDGSDPGRLRHLVVTLDAGEGRHPTTEGTTSALALAARWGRRTGGVGVTTTLVVDGVAAADDDAVGGLLVAWSGRGLRTLGLGLWGSPGVGATLGVHLLLGGFRRLVDLRVHLVRCDVGGDTVRGLLAAAAAALPVLRSLRLQVAHNPRVGAMGTDHPGLLPPLASTSQPRLATLELGLAACGLSDDNASRLWAAFDNGGFWPSRAHGLRRLILDCSDNRILTDPPGDPSTWAADEVVLDLRGNDGP